MMRPRLRSGLVRTARIATVVLLAAMLLQPQAAGQGVTFALFEAYLDSLRLQAGIPGLSAAVISGDRIVWERDLGLRDVERSIPIAPNTPYLIADLTQTVTATLVLDCAARGAISLDDRIARWSSAISEPDATVRHVLSHTSEGTPGRSFRYNPARYSALAAVVADCGDAPFPRVLADEILDRLGMVDSVPGHDAIDPPTRELFDSEQREDYARALPRLAIPYRVDAGGRAVRSEYPTRGLTASTGLISTVRDLARFNAALDDDLMSAESTRLAWTNGGPGLPFGHGWFVQSYNGVPVVWHFGSHQAAFSSLFLKVPDRDLTLILLANSDGLSASFRLGDGDVTSSLFARLFLRLFV